MPRLKFTQMLKALLLAVVLYLSSLLYANREQLWAETRFFISRYGGVSSVPSPSWTSVHTFLHKSSLLSESIGLKTPDIAGCRLPQLDPWDPGILQYVTDFPQVECRNTQKPLLYVKRNILYLNQTAVRELDTAGISCRYAYIRHLSTDTYELLPEVVLSNSSTVLSANYTAVYATCFRNSHAFPRSILPENVFRFFGMELYRNLLLYVPVVGSKKVREKESEYSVVTLIFDSLSQMNLKRSFPESLKVLESAGAILYEGHHKVGHNTYPNVMGLLSGNNGGEWPADSPSRQGMYYFDVEKPPLITQIYRKYGYTTLHLEDMQLYGDLTRVGTVGFKHPPAQIYYRSPLWALVQTWSDMRNVLIGKFGAYACLQDQMLHVQLFRVIEDFVMMYRENLYSAYIHLSEYIHNDVNMAKHYDKDFAAMLTRLLESGALEHTFFLVLGDHGYQRAEGQFVLTEQGRTENNMAAFTLIPPQSWVNNNNNNDSNNEINYQINENSKHQNKIRLQNLSKNAKYLTSHYDIHQTLRDILRMANNSAESDFRLQPASHGSSLFTDFGSRTCKQADVPEEFCSCSDGLTQLDPKREDLRELTVAVLKDREESLRSLGLCHPLKLANIKDVFLKEEKGSKLFKVQLTVQAKSAQFEAVIKIENGADVSVKLTRQDWYSGTGSCVPTKLAYLKPYCICR